MWPTTMRQGLQSHIQAISSANSNSSKHFQEIPRCSLMKNLKGWIKRPKIYITLDGKNVIRNINYNARVNTLDILVGLSDSGIKISSQTFQQFCL